MKSPVKTGATTPKRRFPHAAIIVVAILAGLTASFMTKTTTGQSHREFFESLKVSDGLNLKIDFIDGGPGSFECYDVCDSTRVQVTSTRPMSFDEYNNLIDETFSSSSQKDKDENTKTDWVHISKANPRFCDYLQNINNPSSYTPGMTCNGAPEFWQLAASWKYNLNKNLELPECTTMTGLLTSRYSNLDKDLKQRSDVLSSTFECDNRSFNQITKQTDLTCINYSFCP